MCDEGTHRGGLVSTALARAHQALGGFCPAATLVTEQTPCCGNGHFCVRGMLGGKEKYRESHRMGTELVFLRPKVPPLLCEAKPTPASGQYIIHFNPCCILATHLLDSFQWPVPSRQEIAMVFWKIKYHFPHFALLRCRGLVF